MTSYIMDESGNVKYRNLNAKIMILFTNMLPCIDFFSVALPYVENISKIKFNTKFSVLPISSSLLF